MSPRQSLPIALVISLLFAPLAAADDTQIVYDRITLSAQAEAEVENDLFEAELAVQREGSNPALLAEQVNREMAWGLAQARAVEGVTVQTLGYRSQPVYQQQRLVAWRVRQGLRLQGRDVARLSRLLGSLQTRLTLERVGYRVSPERLDSEEQRLTGEAIGAFRERARLVTEAMGREAYRLVEMRIDSPRQPPRPLLRGVELAAAAAPPLAPGSQRLQVHITATIELQGGKVVSP